jgi:flagellar hook assembly protein FlgD
VSVRVYNMAAQLVREIVSNEPQGKGRSEVQWDGMTGSGSGRSLATARNGRYVIEIEVKDSTGKQSALATVVLVK